MPCFYYTRRMWFVCCLGSFVRNYFQVGTIFLLLLIHSSIYLFSWTSFKLTHKPVLHRHLIWTLMAFTHVVTIFCVVWFFVSHIWFARQFRIKYDDYRYLYGSYNSDYYNNGYDYVNYYQYDFDRELRKFTIVMFVVHYVVGGFMILVWLWNFVRDLRRSKANTQDRLAVEEPINHEKMTGISVINVQYL